MKQTEGSFEGYGDIELFFQTWEPEGKSKGLLVVTHGHGEHSDCYSRLVEALKPLEWTILGWDLRGHGRSQGQRGFAQNFLDYIYDFELLWRQVLPNYRKDDQPAAFFAHSMGALVQLKALAGIHRGETQAQVLSSPYLGLTLAVPAYKEMAALMFRNVLPHVTMSNEIRYEDLSRDPKVIEEYSRDVLRHAKMSAGAFLGAQECQASVLARPEIWKGPMSLLLSDTDPVVNTPTNQHFFQSLKTPRKECHVFEGRKHELINDLGREEVFGKIASFLTSLDAKTTKS